jgi:hypothetical protein
LCTKNRDPSHAIGSEEGLGKQLVVIPRTQPAADFSDDHPTAGSKPSKDEGIKLSNDEGFKRSKDEVDKGFKPSRDEGLHLLPSTTTQLLLPFETFGFHIVRRLGLGPVLLFIDTQLQTLMSLIPQHWSVLLVCVPLGGLYLLRILVGRVNKNVSSVDLQY